MRKVQIIYAVLFVTVVFFHFKAGAQQTVGLFLSDTSAVEGYTLFSPNKTTYLIDNCGYEIHSWQHNTQPGLTAYLLEDGSLLRAGIGGTILGAGSGGLIEKYDWDGILTWSYLVNDSTALQHHDIEPMPNGNILVPAWEVKSIADGIQAGSNQESGFWSFIILELEPIGSDKANVVWEWRLWDHIIQDHDATKDNYGVVADHPELLDINFIHPSNNGDWIHVNGMDYNPERDEIMFSAWRMNEIYIIDHSTSTTEAAGHAGGKRGKGGDFLYRWGNPIVYDAGTVNDQKLFQQHDPQWIPFGYRDEGKITIFNNGSGRAEGSFSSIELIAPDIDSNGDYLLEMDNTFGPEAASWQYIADEPIDFFSLNMGGAHRLSNGHTFITESNSGRFFEIDLDGNIVWDYVNATNSSGPVSQGTSGNIPVFRATRYAVDYSAFIDKDLSIGNPIELNPINYSCPSITTPAVNFNTLKGIQIVGNPVSQKIRIEVENNPTLRVYFFDITGYPLHQSSLKNGMNEFDVLDWTPGIYIIRIVDADSNEEFSYRVIKI